MKLIRELNEQLEVLEEAAASGEKHYYVYGTCLQSGVLNRNNRIYPPPVLEREVNRYIEEQVKAKCAWGELGHPDTPKLNEDRISHRFTDLHQEGTDWVGKAIVCGTRSGGDVIAMIKSGGRLGISSRGIGSLRTDEKTGVHMVQDDYRLMVGGDIVMNPSAPKAWLDSVVEGADWWQDDRGEWRQGVVAVREAVKEMSKSELRDGDKIAKLFENFIARLGSPDPRQRMVHDLAKRAGVSEARVRELWETHGDVAVVKKRLGLNENAGIHYVSWKHNTSGEIKRVRVAAENEDKAKAQSRKQLRGGSDNWTVHKVERP